MIRVVVGPECESPSREFDSVRRSESVDCTMDCTTGVPEPETPERGVTTEFSPLLDAYSEPCLECADIFDALSLGPSDERL